ncbi:IclR family transcriptional regulator [Nocardiopsis composta]|uniref:DNA-binding IclR family transcriptional regulator n=1 Tax=Nocardiopsis composta TaxID=157465 RepID=A0A7W8QJ16_9ACTN|nr:helix-turn-helix domain-containing protein [Nocardiopsis composta]MBB5430904.1 DNA-binding IclR family transcriptional regulator [Nocardiopsis composta]
MAEQSTRTVERALDLLAAVADRGEASLTECARLADLAPSTALRLLRTLESAGFVQRDDEGAFRPGHRLIGIGAKALGHDALAATAQPSLHELARASGESGYLCVGTPDQGVLYIAQAEGSRTIRHVSWVGHRFPQDGSATGRVLRGETPEEGWVAAASVVEPDVVAVAAPVRAPTGTVAALSVVGPAYRLTGERVRELGEMVLAEAEHVSAKLGASAEEPAPGEGRSR